MGFSDTSPYGGEIFTLNIASLAYQSAMFTNFHVAPTCTPTRAMLLTGRDNHIVGVGNMKELLADNQFGERGYEGGLNSRAVTIATILRAAGYHRYMAGKWPLGQTKERLPASQGFEESVVLGEGGADNWEKKSYTPKYNAVHFYEGFNEIDLPADFYSSKFYTDRLLGYIDKNANDGKPFFGYLAFQAVHQPPQAPAEFTKRYVWTYRVGWSAIKQMRYHIMTSEGGTRAPLVIRYPKKVAVGERTDTFAYVLDVVPTLLDLAGVTPQQVNELATFGGRSMIPLFCRRFKGDSRQQRGVLRPSLLGIPQCIAATTSWYAICHRFAISNGTFTISVLTQPRRTIFLQPTLTWSRP
jgi:arylsulfatase A-like enzyme